MSFVVLLSKARGTRLGIDFGTAAPSVEVDPDGAISKAPFNAVNSLKMYAHVLLSIDPVPTSQLHFRFDLQYRSLSLTQHQLLSSPISECRLNNLQKLSDRSAATILSSGVISKLMDFADAMTLECKKATNVNFEEK
jgi:hypothetical protein